MRLGIRLALYYTDTWTCHQHKGSRLATNTDLTPPSVAQAAHSPPPPQRNQNPRISHFPPVPPGLVKPKPYPLTPSSSPRAKHIHMSHTSPYLSPHSSQSTSPALDKIPEPHVPPRYALAATTPPPDLTPALPSPLHSHSTHTCNTNNSTCITVVVVCPLQPSSSANPGCPGPESSVPVSSRLACPTSSHVTDHWG